MVNRISATLRRVPVIRFRYEGPDQRGFSSCTLQVCYTDGAKRCERKIKMKRHNRFDNIGGNHYGTLSLLRVRIQRRFLLSGRLLLRSVQEEAVRVRGGLQM